MQMKEIDPPERTLKQYRDVELWEDEDFDDEASIVVSATSIISSVSDIKQNLSSTSTPIEPSSSESSHKTSIEPTSRDKLEKMLQNLRNKIIHWKLHD